MLAGLIEPSAGVQLARWQYSSNNAEGLITSAYYESMTTQAHQETGEHHE